MRKPTRRASKNYDMHTSRKKRLKKYLNWSKSTRGTNVKNVYL